MTGVDRDPRPVRLAGGDHAPPGGILQHDAEPGDGGERRDDAGRAAVSRGPRQGRSGPEGAGRRRRTAAGAGRLQRGARGRGGSTPRGRANSGSPPRPRRADAREGARQVMAVDEHQAGRAVAASRVISCRPSPPPGMPARRATTRSPSRPAGGCPGPMSRTTTRATAGRGRRGRPSSRLRSRRLALARSRILR